MKQALPSGSAASGRSSARRMPKPLRTSRRGSSCSRRCRTPLSIFNENWTCRRTWGRSLIATKGYAAPEVAQTYTRARELCQQMGETPQLFLVLSGLRHFYEVRAELQTHVGWGNSS